MVFCFVDRSKYHLDLMADGETELRLYARTIGLKSSWISRTKHGIPMFKCSGNYMHAVLVDDKVVKLSKHEFQKRYNSLMAKEMLVWNYARTGDI